MGYNQMQSNPQEQFVQVPLDIEHGPPINLRSDSKQRRNKLLTIIICIIVAVTGQSITRLLENYFFLHRNKSRRYGILTQPLLQVIGFPILLFPFLLFLLKKQKQLLITSGGVSLKQLAITYPILCVCMFTQAFLSDIRYRIPFGVFTVIYTTQLLWTPLISSYLNKIKPNKWKFISISFSFLAGAFTFSTFSPGSPIFNWKKSDTGNMYVAFCAAFFFSLLLCKIRSVFEELTSVCKTSTSSNRKKPSFAIVFELLIFTSLLVTIILVTAVFISGEHHDMKREMNEFSKGEAAYLRTMVGQAVAWQIYWVGIVGLVFAVSATFSTVISVCTWPIVSLLVAIFYHRDHKYDFFLGTALGMATLSVVAYIWVIHNEKSDCDESTG